MSSVFKNTSRKCIKNAFTEKAWEDIAQGQKIHAKGFCSVVSLACLEIR